MGIVVAKPGYTFRKHVKDARLLSSHIDFQLGIEHSTGKQDAFPVLMMRRACRITRLLFQIARPL